MVCQLWLPTISQVLWSRWVHFFGVLLLTKNTSSLVLPILHTKSKSSVHCLWSEDEHQQGPPDYFELLLWKKKKNNIASWYQKWNRPIQRCWGSHRGQLFKQYRSECDLYCIGKLSCTVGSHWETGTWGCLSPTSDPRKSCQVPSNLASSWVRLVHCSVMGRGKNCKQLRVLKSLCLWVELGVKWSPTEVAIVYSTICKCLQWEREVKKFNHEILIRGEKTQSRIQSGCAGFCEHPIQWC